MRWRKLAIATGTVAVLAAAAFGWRWWQSDRLEQLHIGGDETPVAIGVAAPIVRCEIYRAGREIGGAAIYGPCPVGTSWLPKGSYFVRVSHAGGAGYYPLPILGYRLGPDRDGAFVLTVRPWPPRQPPLAREGSRLSPTYPAVIS
jgi:hypothetical protein